MLDPRTLEERRDEIAESIRKRQVRADVDAAIEAQRDVTALQTELNEANRQRNEHQKAGKRKLDDAEREAHNTEGRRLKEAIGEVEARLRSAREALDAAAGALPNHLHPSVPEGGEEDFALLSTWGEPTRFDFEPLDHLAIGEKLDLFDFDGGAKVAGAKFYYLKNDAVLLDLALQRYALDIAMEAGFTPVVTPDLARPAILEGTGFNPARRGDAGLLDRRPRPLPRRNGRDHAWRPAGGPGDRRRRTPDQARRPVALLPHRSGCRGRESKGLYRVHQFTKVEMFATCRPEDSDALHDEMREIEERVFQGLEIPYRVIDVASADLGAPAYRKFDIEAWMPGRGDGGGYGEVTSTSNCTDYQARRLKARFKRKGEKKTEFVHTLNGTAVAIARTLIPLLENHQQADGSVRVPAALRAYVGRDVLEPR